MHESFDELMGQHQTLVIYRPLIKFMGGHAGALMLSQIIYWSRIKKGGWFYKSYDEWEHELEITKRVASGIIKKCKDMGFLKTKVKKANGAPTLHYLFDHEIFHKKFSEFRKDDLYNGKLQIVTIENDKLSQSIESNKLSQSITKTTTETTTKTTKKSYPKGQAPYDVYLKLLTIEPGLPKGPSLRDIKVLLDGDLGLEPSSIDDIFACAKYLQSTSWFRENMVPVTPGIIRKRITRWKEAGRPIKEGESIAGANGYSAEEADQLNEELNR